MSRITTWRIRKEKGDKDPVYVGLTWQAGRKTKRRMMLSPEHAEKIVQNQQNLITTKGGRGNMGSTSVVGKIFEQGDLGTAGRGGSREAEAVIE